MIPHQHLNMKVFKVAAATLNVTSDYLYEECSQNPIGHLFNIMAGRSVRTQDSGFTTYYVLALFAYRTAKQST